MRFTIIFLLLFFIFGCTAKKDNSDVDTLIKMTMSERDNFVGSTLSMRYHTLVLSCDYARNIPEECMVSFPTAESAKKHGFVPCKLCNFMDSTATAKPDTSIYFPPQGASNYPHKWITRVVHDGENENTNQ